MIIDLRYIGKVSFSWILTAESCKRSKISCESVSRASRYTSHHSLINSNYLFFNCSERLLGPRNDDNIVNFWVSYRGQHRKPGTRRLLDQDAPPGRSPGQCTTRFYAPKSDHFRDQCPLIESSQSCCGLGYHYRCPGQVGPASV